MLNYKKHVKQSVNVIKVRDIEDANLIIIEYVSIIFCILDVIVDDNFVIVTFIKNVYIVDDLKTKMLLSNDILKSKQIILNIVKKKLIIDNCQNMIVKLTIVNREISMKRIIRFVERIKIFVRFNIVISFKLRDKVKLFVDRDFMFISQRIDRLKTSDGVLSHIVNVNIEIVMIQNANHEKIFILKNNRIDVIQNYEKKKCYFVAIENVHFAVNSDNHKSTFQN